MADALATVLTYDSAADYTTNIGQAAYVSDAGIVTLSSASTAQGSGVPGIIVDVLSTTEVSICVHGRCQARVGDDFDVGTTTGWAMAAADGRLDPYAILTDTVFGSQNVAIGFFTGAGNQDLANADRAEFFVSPQLRPDSQT